MSFSLCILESNRPKPDCDFRKNIAPNSNVGRRQMRSKPINYIKQNIVKAYIQGRIKEGGESGQVLVWERQITK